MASSDHMFATIEAGDADRLEAILAVDPGLAAMRDHAGVSALMRARYRSDPELPDAVRRRVDELDVFEAAALGDVERLRELLQADPSASSALSADGFSALHLAAFFAGPAASGLLLAHGADPDARGRGWMTGTPLHSAASVDDVASARLLMDAGADPDARQSGGWTPLHSAASNGSTEMLDLLLSRGADPTLANDDGESVLAIAERSADPATVKRVRQALA